MALLGTGETRALEIEAGRHAWVHVARGETSLGGTGLGEGDGAAVTGETRLVFDGGDAEILVFDLA